MQKSYLCIKYSLNLYSNKYQKQLFKNRLHRIANVLNSLYLTTETQ